MITFIPFADMTISYCKDCGVCKHLATQGKIGCHIDDDMTDLRALLDMCDELFIISPVYFAGAPAYFKAFLDRLQPYFWAHAHVDKRFAHLFVVGEGHDPHGFCPLVATVRSALAVAGFYLEDVHDWTGLPVDDGMYLASVDCLSGGRIDSASAYKCSDPDRSYPCKTYGTGIPRYESALAVLRRKDKDDE